MSNKRYLTALPAWVMYIIGLIPAALLFYAAVNNTLGPDPLDALENELGEWALKFLIIGLCFTPLMRFARVNLVKYRRPIGLLAFSYVVLHFGVYLILDRQLAWWEIWADIVKRPYITIGTGAFLLLLPLAITSNNRSVKRLGAATWRNLHKLVYPAAFMGALHFLLLAKNWQIEPIVYLSIISALIALRLYWALKKRPARVKSA